MTVHPLPDPHPILGAVLAAGEALEGVRDVQPVFMTAAEQESAIAEIARLEAHDRGAEAPGRRRRRRCRREAGARDIGAWLASVTRPTSRPAAGRGPPCRRAGPHLDPGRGRDGRRARVPGAGPGRRRTPSTHSPTTSTPSWSRGPRPRWSSTAQDFRPSELRRLGRHLLEVVAPEIAEAEEAKRLEDEEQRAREKTSLRSRPSATALARDHDLHPDARPRPAPDLPRGLHQPPQAPRRDQWGGGPDPLPPPPRPRLLRPPRTPRPHQAAPATAGMRPR